MLNIVHEGKTVYFDFSTVDYPRPDGQLLGNVLGPIIDKGDVPFRKWVALLDTKEGWESILEGAPETNWEGIVEVLDEAPSQFVGDLFWRIKRLRRRPSGRELIPRQVREDEAGGAAKETREVSFGYHLKEDDEASIEVVTHSGAGNPERRARYTHRVTIEASEQCPVDIIGPDYLDMRPHSADLIKVRVSREASVLARQGTVSLLSPETEGGYPVGPRITLVFTAQKRLWETTAGFLCLMGSVAAHLTSGQVIKDDMCLGVFLGLTAAVLLGLGVLTMTNRLPIKLR